VSHNRVAAMACMSLLGLSPALSGCSLLFVKGPSADRHVAPSECTNSYAFPLIDGGLTALAVVIAASGIRNLSRAEGGTPALLIGASGVAVAGGSTVWGYRQVSRCLEAQATIKPHELRRFDVVPEVPYERPPR